VTIRIGDEFRMLSNLPQDRKEKCNELKPTDADQDRTLAAFCRRGGTVDAAFPAHRLSGALHSCSGDAPNEVRRVSIVRAILRIHLAVMREEIRALQTETDGRRIPYTEDRGQGQD